MKKRQINQMAKIIVNFKVRQKISDFFTNVIQMRFQMSNFEFPDILRKDALFFVSNRYQSLQLGTD